MSSGDDNGKRFRDSYVTVPDGLTLHYRDYPGGNGGPPLLCLPGLTRNARDFAELAERYSPRFRVLALEFRGRGASDFDPVPARYMPPTYVGDVLHFLQETGISRAIFIGTSLGGLVTMMLAAVKPDAIAGAILNDVGPELDPAGIERIRTYVGHDARFNSWDEAARAIAAKHASSFERYGHDDWVRMAERNCRNDNGEIRFDYDMAIALPFSAPPGAAPQVDLWPLYRALAEKPLLIVRGAKSDLLAEATAERMVAEAPGSTLVTVAGVGHAPELNEPEAVAAIDRFLARFED